MNDIKKKHGNDKAKLQQEQMKLYKERGINPIGGCLPMVVFFPVLFAMYAAFQQVGGLSGAHALTVEQLRDSVLWPFLQFTVADRPPDATIDLTAHWLRGSRTSRNRISRGSDSLARCRSSRPYCSWSRRFRRCHAILCRATIPPSERCNR